MQARLFTAIIVMVLFPPVALLLGGLPLAPHYEMPPGYEYQTGEAFSPLGAALLCLTAAGVVWALVTLLAGRRSESTLSPESRLSGFPKRGWAGLCLLGLGLGSAGWMPMFLAATAALVGMAITLDADSSRRGGSSLVTTNPQYFMGLYLAGAVVGWGAEYLNRFVEVWSVAADLGTWEYVAEITFPAAALLPAAVTTRQWLVQTLFARQAPPLPALKLGQEAKALLLFLLAAVGLMGGTLWPQTLYVAAWGAPVALLFSLRLLWGGDKEPEVSGTRLAASIGGSLVAGGVLAFLYTLTGADWALQDPFMSASPSAGAALLGFVLFSFYGLVVLQIANWIAAAWASPRGQSRGRRPFPIPVKVESRR